MSIRIVYYLPFPVFICRPLTSAPGRTGRAASGKSALIAPIKVPQTGPAFKKKNMLSCAYQIRVSTSKRTSCGRGPSAKSCRTPGTSPSGKCVNRSFVLFFPDERPRLRPVPELVLRQRPGLIDIVPEEVVLPLHEVVDGQGFWLAEERVRELFCVPRVPA
jgi:hypothetical protein